MQLSELIRRRRMVRAFSDEPVARETVERIVEAARRAPSAGNSQGISFVAVTDADTRRRVAEIAGEPWYTGVGHQPFISEAPVQIVICAGEALYRARYAEADKRKGADGDVTWPVPWWYVDAGAALMLLLLAAVDAGLRCAFVGVRSPSDLAGLLGVPDRHHTVGVVLLGHGAPDKRTKSLARRRRSLDEALRWERW